MRKAALLALLAIYGATAAEKDPQQKTVAGFSGMLIVTADKNWQEKWNTSPESIPYFATASTLERDGELFILTLFGNPLQDASGQPSVCMDIDVIRPDGSFSTHAEGVRCFAGPLKGPVQSLHLCASVTEFVGEPADPPGTWSVRIVLKDDVRKVSIPLGTQFVLVGEKPAQ